MFEGWTALRWLAFGMAVSATIGYLGIVWAWLRNDPVDVIRRPESRSHNAPYKTWMNQ